MKHFHLVKNWAANEVVITRPLLATPTCFTVVPDGFEPSPLKPYIECDNALAWTDSNGEWQGDPYNPDAMCVLAIHRDLE